MFAKKIIFFFSFWGLCSWIYAQTAIVRGSVQDAAGDPIIGATVYFEKLGIGANTNLQGLFSISKVPAGKHDLRITYLGYDTVRQNVEVAAGKAITLNFKMTENQGKELETVEIVAEKSIIDPTKVNTGVVKISSKDISLIPTLGTPDLAQYLQVIPGVISTGDLGGQIFVRGGTPIQNKVLLDGAVIYNPFHSIGLFSVFDTDYIRSTDVYTAGFSAEYGGRVSSIMDIKTRTGNLSRFSAKAHLNPFTTGFLAEGPLAKDASSFLISSRYGLIDQISKSMYSYVNDTAGMPYQLVDIFGKVTFGGEANRVNLFGFHQQDKVTYGFPANIQWKSSGGGANFMFLPNNTNAIISGNFALSSYQTGLVSASEAFPRKSSITGFNGGLNFAYIINSVNELSYGIEFLGFSTDLKFSNSLGLITQAANNNTEAAGFVKFKKVFKQTQTLNGEKVDFHRFVLEPSLRAHYYNNQSVVSFEPRIRGKLNFKRISFNAAAGMYSQNLMSPTSDRDVVALFQGFLSAPEDETPKNLVKNNSLQYAIHYLAGVEIRLFNAVDLLVEAWQKNFTQLTNSNRNKLFPTDPTFITETGIARGVDINLKLQTKKLYLSAVYGLSKSERNDFITTYFPVFDRRHNVNLVANYKTGDIEGKFSREAKWEFGLRWSLGSGFPFTQTQALFEKLYFWNNGSQAPVLNQNGNLTIMLSDAYNGSRLPYFHRLDITAKRKFSIKDKFLLEININTFNTYNRENVFYFDRIRNTRVNQLPLVPTAGISFLW
ncbi:MAG: TonB-dependent receptor [Bacteroidia bacterium]|nr:TonB-dependent receptor [Bacteroidia bacterium]